MVHIINKPTDPNELTIHADAQLADEICQVLFAAGKRKELRGGELVATLMMCAKRLMRSQNMTPEAEQLVIRSCVRYLLDEKEWARFQHDVRMSASWGGHG